MFLEDLNMPLPEQYGAQPPLEFLRQFIGNDGFYDINRYSWKVSLGDLIGWFVSREWDTEFWLAGLCHVVVDTAFWLVVLPAKWWDYKEHH